VKEFTTEARRTKRVAGSRSRLAKRIGWYLFDGLPPAESAGLVWHPAVRAAFKTDKESPLHIQYVPAPEWPEAAANREAELADSSGACLLA
jgi:hypothetical protein